MLKLKYLFENYDLAKEALNNWKHDDGTQNEMLSQFRVSSNAIYPFCQNGEVCFLRLAPVEEKQEKNVLGEIEFINYLLEHNYPALVPIKTSTGKECLKINTVWGEYYANAFKSVCGVQIEDTDISNEIMYEYGKSLGRLHSLSTKFVPKTKKWIHVEVLDWIAAALSEYNASDNVFYDKETKSCAVIDFDDGMYHWYALDIEQVFESIEEELSKEAFQTAKNEFIRGYKKEHCYTQEMDALRPLMRRFINLYGYARLIRCVAEKFADEPEWLVELREKLNKKNLEKEASMLSV